ncbi:MAG: N-acetylmuramoyl-L-alanine amidase, partial [Deferrisomatales bacterium]
RAAAAFARVSDGFTDSTLAEQSLFLGGVSLERAFYLSAHPADQSAALELYERLTARSPGSDLAPDALLRAGRILEGRNDAAGARARYRQLLAQAPTSPLAPLAQRRLDGVGRPVTVTGIRSWSSRDYTRVVLDLTGSPAFTPGSLPADPEAGKPPRLFVDLVATRLDRGCPDCAVVEDGVVRQVRAGQPTAGVARVVLDLAAPAQFRVFPLEGPPRLVVDVFGAARAPGAARPEPAAEPPVAPAPRRPRVVVDPGHGGKDPGAIGPGGLMEKDVALAIGLELAEFLRRDGGFEVRLTRERDVTLSLEQRTAVANAFEADLFVSVHTNASPSRQAMGIETYFLDRTSDRSSRRLAARENGGTEEALADVEHILADVILTSKTRESRRLAELVHEDLVGHLIRGYGPVKDLGVKRGPFFVLTGAVMPAVLVEAAFITHPEEARRLTDRRYRRQVAEAVARGIGRFLNGG